jgi:phosphatidylglycerol---prolipoprotein diacylglyceryl transferase
MHPLATIPSPAQGVWYLGPIPLRAYALCILVGIAVAIVITQRRWKARGGDPVIVIDIATWAVPFGVVGGRIYHVITSPEAYFGKGGDPVKALYIWQGGLGIWGAVVLGGVGAWIGCRRNGIKLPPFADAVAPGVVVAQAIGRLGNWFNNELYGRATDLPWGLQIHEWNSATGEAARDNAGNPEVLGYYHPAFLYESLWDIFTAIVLIFADRRWKLGHGRVFALYIAVYSIGRGWIETLRIDEANHILGLRLNVWTAILVFVGGLTYFIVSARRRPGRETELRRTGTSAQETATVGADGSSDSPDVSAVKSKDEDKPADEKATDEKAKDKKATDEGLPKSVGKSADDKSLDETSAVDKSLAGKAKDEGKAKDVEVTKSATEKVTVGTESVKAAPVETDKAKGVTVGTDSTGTDSKGSDQAGSDKAGNDKASSDKASSDKASSTKTGSTKGADVAVGSGTANGGEVGEVKVTEVKDDTVKESPAVAAKVKDDPAGKDTASTDKVSTVKVSTDKAISDKAEDDKGDKTVITVESPTDDAGAKNPANAGTPKPR